MVTAPLLKTGTRVLPLRSAPAMETARVPPLRRRNVQILPRRRYGLLQTQYNCTYYLAIERRQSRTRYLTNGGGQGLAENLTGQEIFLYFVFRGVLG